MINHARTLLLNDTDRSDPAPWDRYMPVEYKPAQLPAYLEGIRAALVGRDAWWDRTYRVEMLLTMMSSPRYEDKYTWLDSRTTPPGVAPFMYYEPYVSVSRVASGTADPYVTYLSKAELPQVPVKRQWQVLGSGTDTFTVKYNDRSASVRAYFSADNNGWLLPLAGDFDLLFSGFGAADDIWNVRSYKRPNNSFADYPAIVNSIPGPWTSSLFAATEPSHEPIKEYAMWFKTCVHPEDRIMAVLLSYLLKTSLFLQ